MVVMIVIMMIIMTMMDDNALTCSQEFGIHFEYHRHTKYSACDGTDTHQHIH